MSRQRGACVTDLPWNEVEERLLAGALPVLTVGAGSKEHGFHLPLDTDLRQATWLGQAIACRWPVVVWPPISSGYYPAFTQYPGSVNIEAETFVETLRNVVTSIRAHTSMRIMIINTGISTITPIDQITQEAGVTAIHVHRGKHLARAREIHCTQRHGGHGDEAETALMRFIAPDCVNMRHAAAFDQPMPAGILSRQSSAPTYTPQGVWGRPDLGTAATGRVLAQAIMADIETTWNMIHADQ